MIAKEKETRRTVKTCQQTKENRLPSVSIELGSK
jgi:hypothetical protein